MLNRRTALTVLAASLLPQAQAYCYYDVYGYYRCTGLSNPARIGIGIAVVILGLVVICLAGWYRRRRIASINKSFTTQGGQQPYQPGYYPPQQGQQYYGSPQPGPYGEWQPAPGTQYPPNAYTGAPPSSGPGTYAPPPGPPTQRNYVSLALTWLSRAFILLEVPSLILACPLCRFSRIPMVRRCILVPHRNPPSRIPQQMFKEFDLHRSRHCCTRSSFLPRHCFDSLHPLPNSPLTTIGPLSIIRLAENQTDFCTCLCVYWDHLMRQRFVSIFSLNLSISRYSSFECEGI
ncbi:hypothetical protein M407DRAFT_94329 [Tulasnella calospora MUT 4182]|uniref:Chitin synthase export chaperone n=1 Tax=Tulasnella calospora MUT 4182 TaxID=1051891 RepID=A0A0C3LUN3_9AGAM|nr:hypothetical protein M407DRAFT_94329 [Tulasnella calospora MUT 4182]